jgi:hypothetical protein
MLIGAAKQLQSDYDFWLFFDCNQWFEIPQNMIPVQIVNALPD